ncbi:DUF5998 family protein [Serinibacter salmoneus]|uniref:Phosphodiesterase n=1 Tax=Serinibacter salmoneus TaxID=556530 RepID=A0A2A9CYQ6_9MICO|nr:DUF5998 family protein [Serinibacter salmoneus]PFG19533.1 hypothetical protein ATL40_1097 [Serinibacter salmoneus]
MRTRSNPDDLATAIRQAGYYPELVGQVIDLALAGEDVLGHLIQPETTFDEAEVKRHLTALVLTPSRLVVVHVDDHAVDGAASAVASTESVPLREVRSVMLTQGFADPAARGPRAATDVTIALGWGAVKRLDLEPATCGDPQCEADHGYTGTASPDDLVIRVSGLAEGQAALDAAIRFAGVLSAATAGR